MAMSPLPVGSGKSSTPLARMHLANSSMAALALGSSGPAPVPPALSSGRQACSAAWTFGSSGRTPSPGSILTRPPWPGLGSGMSTPCWRMHLAKASPAWSGSRWAAGVLPAVVVVVPPALATRGPWPPPPHAASSSAASTRAPGQRLVLCHMGFSLLGRSGVLRRSLAGGP
jgi:hypothetical protein